MSWSDEDQSQISGLPSAFTLYLHSVCSRPTYLNPAIYLNLEDRDRHPYNLTIITWLIDSQLLLNQTLANHQYSELSERYLQNRWGEICLEPNRCDGGISRRATG